jgi:hypothetical protein
MHAVVIDAASDAGGKGHVEQRRAAAAGAEEGLAERAGTLASLSMMTGTASRSRRCVGKPEVAPAADVRGKRHALLGEIHRAAEADAAAVEAAFRPPGARDG